MQVLQQNQCRGPAKYYLKLLGDFLRFLFQVRHWKSFGSGSGSKSRQYLFSMFFNKPKCGENLAFSMSEEALFLRKLASHFLFLYFFIPFYFRSGSKSGSRTGSGTGPGTVMHSAQAKSYGSCGSSSGSSRLFKRLLTKR